MNLKALLHPSSILLISAITLLTACSTVIQEVLEKPDISVTEVRLVKAGLINQKFALTLEVSNPNPVPLPIKSIFYTINLAGEQFASGNNFDSFSVPAHGEEDFEILVKINLLRSAAHLGNVIKKGAATFDYQLVASIDIDLPLLGSIPVSKQGVINLSK